MAAETRTEYAFAMPQFSAPAVDFKAAPGALRKALEAQFAGALIKYKGGWLRVCAAGVYKPSAAGSRWQIATSCCF